MADKFLLILENIGKSIFYAFQLTWWILLPIVLIFVFCEFWMIYIRLKHKTSIKWILLEIKIPRDILKTPKAMEEIFNGFQGIYSYGFKWWEKYLYGKVESWFSLEIVGFGGGVEFYIRTPESHRNLVESAIYAQYPDAEIKEADDYLDLLPTTLPNKEYDLFGAELYLGRESAYPIKTYPVFEAIEEEKRIDPVATLVEIMSRLKEGEFILFQLLIEPVGDEWKKEAEALRDTLVKRKKPAKPAGLLFYLWEFIENLIKAPAVEPEWYTEKPAQESPQPSMAGLTPGEREIVEAIEEKISKIAYRAAIRVLYIDKRTSFTRSNVSAIFGSMKHYSAINLNSFRPNSDTITLVKGPVIFKKQKLYFRKRILFDRYRWKLMPMKTSILNTEELATIYHLPITLVEAPKLARLVSKKGEPPSNLPIAE